jgi:hypothetical protein
MLTLARHHAAKISLSYGSVRSQVEQRTRADREGRGRRAALLQRTEESDAYIQGSAGVVRFESTHRGHVPA